MVAVWLCGNLLASITVVIYLLGIHEPALN